MGIRVRNGHEQAPRYFPSWAAWRGNPRPPPEPLWRSCALCWGQARIWSLEHRAYMICGRCLGTGGVPELRL